MKNKPYPYYNAPDEKTLKDLIEVCCNNHKDKIAFRYTHKNDEIQITYTQFKNDVEALGTALIKKGYNRTHIALLSKNSYLWIVSFFAIVNTDNIIVPLDKELSGKDIRSLIEKSDTEVLIYENTYSDEAQLNKDIMLLNMDCLPEMIENGKNLIANGDTSYKDCMIDKDAMCAIYFTSGTTGDTKGVMLSHKNWATDICTGLKCFHVAEKTLLALPLYHTYAIIASLLASILSGSSLFINSSIKKLISDIRYVKPEYIAVVPVMAEAMYKKIMENINTPAKKISINVMITLSRFLLFFGIDIRRKLFKKILDAFGGNLKSLVIGGASPSEKYVRSFVDFGIEACVGYGTTECSPLISVTRNKHYVPKSVGTILPKTNVRIKDGEIQIKSDIVFSGYYKDEEATKSVFDEEWFKTGDLGYIKNNFLYITGRIKNLIILSNGKNVSPEELEALIKTIDDVDEVMVYDKDDIIIAEIFSTEITEEKKKNITSNILQLNKTLPSYKQIGKTIFKDTEFKKTATKKIVRKNEENKND